MREPAPAVASASGCCCPGPPTTVAVGETVILLHPPLLLSGVSIGIKRGSRRRLDDGGSHGPVPGFELEASVPVEGDVFSAEVVWQEHGPDLSGLAASATTVKLSFELRSAELFSYRFE